MVVDIASRPSALHNNAANDSLPNAPASDRCDRTMVTHCSQIRLEIGNDGEEVFHILGGRLSAQLGHITPAIVNSSAILISQRVTSSDSELMYTEAQAYDEMFCLICSSFARRSQDVEICLRIDAYNFTSRQGADRTGTNVGRQGLFEHLPWPVDARVQASHEGFVRRVGYDTAHSPFVLPLSPDREERPVGRGCSASQATVVITDHWKWSSRARADA
jgi:hypothetical protein